MEAQYLTEIELTPEPSVLEIDDIGESYTNFMEGWVAAVNYIAGPQGKIIAAWIRSKGEPTTWICMSGEEYPSLVVKEGDVEELEKGETGG